jgi:hypothetical protein
MEQRKRPQTKLLTPTLLLMCLVLSSITCSSANSLLAGTAPETATPSTTEETIPQGLLSTAERSQYSVILRSDSADIRNRFQPIQDFLADQGYSVAIDNGKSDLSDMDIIQFGQLSCKDAIDDMEILLEGRLDLRSLTRMRFPFEDSKYAGWEIVIQIQDAGLFGAGG